MRNRQSLLWSALGAGTALALALGLLPTDAGTPGAGSAASPSAGGPSEEPVRSASFERAARPPAHSTVAADAARIRMQLARVERRLRSRPPAGLSAEQRRKRREALRHLRQYRERGIFPVNADFPGRRVPYFVDRNGTLCALAYLVWESGHRGLVARVAATRNNGYVRELASDPRLRSWLDEHGITAGEAAMIQPSYEGRGCVACVTPPEDPVDGGFVVASAIGSGLSVWSGLSNTSDLSSDGSRSVAGSVGGAIAGAATAALGVTRLDTEGASLAVGIADAALGTTAAALGAVSLLSGGDSPASRTGGGGDGSPDAEVSIRPWSATPEGTQPGLGVQLRF